MHGRSIAHHSNVAHRIEYVLWHAGVGAGPCNRAVWHAIAQTTDAVRRKRQFFNV